MQFPGNRLGFESLDAFEEPQFPVVFISGFEKYAMNTVRFGALDYLVKPVDTEHVEKVLQTVQRKYEEKIFSQEQIQVMFYHLAEALG